MLPVLTGGQAASATQGARESAVRGTPQRSPGQPRTWQRTSPARSVTLPPAPPGALFYAEEQAKYRAFKEARRGAADYMAMEGEFSKYLEDVYSAEPVPREALTDECEILVVGAGFAGLLLWHKLRNAGFGEIEVREVPLGMPFFLITARKSAVAGGGSSQ